MMRMRMPLGRLSEIPKWLCTCRAPDEPWFLDVFIKPSARIVQVRRVGPAKWGDRHGIIRITHTRGACLHFFFPA